MTTGEPATLGSGRPTARPGRLAAARVALRAHPDLAVIALLACAALAYVSLAWSPSSYGVALDLIGARGAGLVAGQARGIRSDEWAITTPFTQALVRTNFRRRNITSYYREDLRCFYTLPVGDWGLLFKPTLWGYRVLPPAHAFSAHYAACAVLLLAGTALLARRLGVDPLPAWLLSFSIFFTAATQFWWTTHAAGFAVFPWVLLSVLAQGPPLLHWAAVYLSTSVLLFEFFYPPFAIAFAFVALVLVLAFARHLLKPRTLVLLASAAAAAALTAGAYYGDYISALGATRYPGRRIMTGGLLGSTSLLSLGLPLLELDGYRSLVQTAWDGMDVCATAVAGSYFFLLVLCCLDYRVLGRTWRRAEHRSWLVVLAGVALMGSWMFVPLPSWVGMPLLWHRIPGQRLAFGMGLLMFIAAYLAARGVGLRMSGARLAIATALVLVPTWLFKHQHGGVPLHALGLDASILLLAAAPLVVRSWVTTAALPSYFLGASLAVNVVVFGGFNPVQSAKPIFDVPVTPVLKQLRAEAATQGKKPLLDNRLPGAVTNGLGFSAVQHVTHLPALRVWEQAFPDMDPTDLDGVFNRYAHILLKDVETPRLLQIDAIEVPLQAMRRRADARWVCAESQQGHVDSLKVEGERITVTGWAPWQGNFFTQRLHVLGLGKRSTLTLRTRVREDIERTLRQPVYRESGFELEIEPARAGRAERVARELCLVAEDRRPDRTLFVLENPFAPDACRAWCDEGGPADEEAPTER